MPISFISNRIMFGTYTYMYRPNTLGGELLQYSQWSMLWNNHTKCISIVYSKLRYLFKMILVSNFDQLSKWPGIIYEWQNALEIKTMQWQPLLYLFIFSSVLLGWWNPSIFSGLIWNRNWFIVLISFLKKKLETNDEPFTYACVLLWLVKG